MALQSHICNRCARALQKGGPLAAIPLQPLRQFSKTPRSSNSNSPKTDPQSPSSASQASNPEPEPDRNALSRRLEQATEDALLEGGRAGRRAVLEDAGFSAELKARLLDKLAHAQFTSENAASLAEAGMPSTIPSSAGQGTRDVAAAAPWTGTETPEDAVLRMLDDAHKPLRPGLRGKAAIPPPVVDLRIRNKAPISPGRRAVAAREKAAVYADSGAKDAMSDKEREARRREFRERFEPGARAMPNTISGLAALANERIEDAIARGQFKNIPRGKGVERDARADNPFIDTTEYIMNKMIKRQEIVPPWIEKQQELVKASHVFRSRLRNDWKRHAARMIASRGGSLQEQMARAEEYARAEEVHNPRRRNPEQISVPTNATDDVVMAKIRKTPGISATSQADTTTIVSEPGQEAGEVGAAENTTASSSTAPTEPHISFVRPFRDPDWEALERSYLELSVSHLNALTRSYNLMAPELAKKPYFSLEREMAACYADVAPELASTIKQRAAKPAAKSLAGMAESRSAGFLEQFGGSKARIYESNAPHYGFKEMWRDMWKREGEGSG